MIVTTTDLRTPRRVVRLTSPMLVCMVLMSTMWMADNNDHTLVDPPSGATDAGAYFADVPLAWFELQMELIERTPGFSPPVASRALGYSSVALYEAVVPGMNGYRSLAGQLNGLASVPDIKTGSAYHWPAVANSVLARITRKLYANTSPEFTARIDGLEAFFSATYKGKIAEDIIDRSTAHGRAIADAIFEWSKSDGGHEGYSKNFPAYTPPAGPGMWVPTPRSGGTPQSALQPYWGKNRPFVLPVGQPSRDCDPGPPPAYSTDPTSDFYREGFEVYTTVKRLSTEQRAIALFWADDAGKTCTPPGHSFSILSQCIRMKKSSLEFAAEAYAKLGIALADAFISCWDVKYRYNLIRPITYIQAVIDPKWNTPIITDPLDTPPFPEYPSGHSVQSGAATRVLTSLYGVGFAFIDHTHHPAGQPARSFTSFDAFANEAAISRLYGGIHFRSAIERGVRQGKRIGEAVLKLKFKA